MLKENLNVVVYDAKMGALKVNFVEHSVRSLKVSLIEGLHSVNWENVTVKND